MNKISDKLLGNPVPEAIGFPQKQKPDSFSQERDLDQEGKRFADLMEKSTSGKDPSSQVTKKDDRPSRPEKGEKEMKGCKEGKDAPENLPERKNRLLPEDAGESLENPMNLYNLSKPPLQVLLVPESVQAGNPDLSGTSGSPPPEVSEIARNVAERILVAEPSLTGKQEVRITLKESVLPETEIRISKEAGKLSIDFFTTSDHSYRIISQEKAGLQQVLAERLGPKVKIEVGVSDTGREHNQGRSRQQRSVLEEWQP
jgi:type III secretion system needle length determinant